MFWMCVITLVNENAHYFTKWAKITVAIICSTHTSMKNSDYDTFQQYFHCTGCLRTAQSTKSHVNAQAIPL